MPSRIRGYLLFDGFLFPFGNRVPYGKHSLNPATLEQIHKQISNKRLRFTKDEPFYKRVQTWITHLPEKTKLDFQLALRVWRVRRGSKNDSKLQDLMRQELLNLRFERPVIEPQPEANVPFGDRIGRLQMEGFAQTEGFAQELRDGRRLRVAPAPQFGRVEFANPQAVAQNNMRILMNNPPLNWAAPVPFHPENE